MIAIQHIGNGGEAEAPNQEDDSAGDRCYQGGWDERGNEKEAPKPDEEEDIAEKDDGVAIKEDDAGSSISYPHKNKSFTVIAWLELLWTVSSIKWSAYVCLQV